MAAIWIESFDNMAISAIADTSSADNANAAAELPKNTAEIITVVIANASEREYSRMKKT